jgi:hypothetical protein
MAAGMVLTPRAQGSKRKRFGAKPKMTDTWLAQGGEKWDSIMVCSSPPSSLPISFMEKQPLCAQSVFVKRKYRDGQGPRATGNPISVLADTSETPTSPAPLASPPESFSHRLNKFLDRRQFSRAPTVDTPDTNVQLATPAPTGTYKVRVEMLQISVLVAMPSPGHAMRKNARLDRLRSLPTSDINAITYHDNDESGDETDEEEEGTVLPELLFGVTRVNYPKPSTKPSDEMALEGAPPLVDVGL